MIDPPGTGRPLASERSDLPGGKECRLPCPLRDPGRRSARVVKDDAQRLTVPGPHPAHPVAQVDAIVAARPSHWTMADGKDDAVPLAERHDLDARLHARPLLGQHELATGEVSIRPREQEGDLEREDVLPVEL
jgi:hypothetical protein